MTFSEVKVRQISSVGGGEASEVEMIGIRGKARNVGTFWIGSDETWVSVIGFGTKVCTVETR